LNLLEGYFSVHNFLNRETITFALLKAFPHVKDWWETFCEQNETEEPSLFIVKTTWEFFRDAIKEQYYPVGSYDELYTKWTTLWQERDQTVPEFTNISHTLRTKMGIKDSERHLVLKYRGALHRYIQTEMEFLDILSLGATYRYPVKIEQNLKQKTRQFGPGNPSAKAMKGRPQPTEQRTKQRWTVSRQLVQATRKGHRKDKERYREVVRLP
jgi:hypothetical protein